MKKIFLSMAVLATSVAAFAATDNNDHKCVSPEKCGTEKTVCENGKDCEVRKDCTGSPLFKGINLTDDQKTKLADLRTKMKAERKQAKADLKKAREEKKNSGEKLKGKKLRKSGEYGARCEAERKSYLNGVKEILTADQYVIFLENNYLMGGQDVRSFQPMHKGHGARDGRHGGRGERFPMGDRTPKPQN